MFDTLTQRFESVFSSLRGKGKLTEKDIDAALREVRLALLEADVNVSVVKTFLARVKERALGEDVSKSISPGQQVVKIVHDELVNTLGRDTAELAKTSPPLVILMVGLQGSGKTTTAGKLAQHLKSKGRRPLLVAADLQRPAAIDQLETLAGRVGVPIDLTALNRLSDDTPVLVDLKPSGQHYMEDFFAAGGLGAVLRELRDRLHLDCLTVTGETLGARLEGTDDWVDRAVIRSVGEPFQPVGGLVALFGSLAPGGAILKRSAADARLFEREGRAVVFESLEDLSARIDDPALDVTPADFLVLKNAGPKGAPGMPEAGYLPIPTKLSRAGVTDMVRISDARMSGTAFGTIVLHVTPEAAAGGPLAQVRSGDRIRLSVNDRRLDLLVDPAELARRAAGASTAPTPSRGYRRLYAEHVLQADAGCDFDFLRTGGSETASRLPADRDAPA